MLYTYRHISIVHTIQTEHIEYVQIHAYICSIYMLLRKSLRRHCERPRESPWVYAHLCIFVYICMYVPTYEYRHMHGAIYTKHTGFNLIPEARDTRICGGVRHACRSILIHAIHPDRYVKIQVHIHTYQR